MRSSDTPILVRFKTLDPIKTSEFYERLPKAREQGIDEMFVLQKMIEERLHDSFINSYSIDCNTGIIKDLIQKVPFFQDKGEFNENSFQNYLGSVGISQEEYISECKRGIITQSVHEAFKKIYVPKNFKIVH